MAITLRRMSAREVVRFTKFTLPEFIGWIVEEDGEDIGAGAVIWGHKGRPYLSLEISEKLRHKPVFIWRMAKLAVKAITQSGELYALESSSEPTAERLLTRLGFKPTGETLNGDRVFKYGG